MSDEVPGPPDRINVNGTRDDARRGDPRGGCRPRRCRRRRHRVRRLRCSSARTPSRPTWATSLPSRTARTRRKDAIHASALSFIRYAEPIDWDGNEVRFVVGIAGIRQRAPRHPVEDRHRLLRRRRGREAARRLDARRSSSSSARSTRNDGDDSRPDRSELTAVHFGAGNIGRGFVGLILHNAGYEVVFADVNAELIDALAAADSLHRARGRPRGRRTGSSTDFRALNSRDEEAEVVAEIASADIVTTAVGPNILRFVAPRHRRARSSRATPTLTPLAGHGLRERHRRHRPPAQQHRGRARRAGSVAMPSREAVFANTAVDRIVPGQDRGRRTRRHGRGLLRVGDREGPVRRRRARTSPRPPSSTISSPYIERKLFTVNTGHATIAYHGFARGRRDAGRGPRAPRGVRARSTRCSPRPRRCSSPSTTSPPELQQKYLEKNLARFANPALSDTVERVGRAPLRKLSRHERFIGPAAELVERGLGAPTHWCARSAPR